MTWAFKRPKNEFRRERRIEVPAPRPVQEQRAQGAVPKEQLDEVVSKSRKIAVKVENLLQAIQDNQAGKSIPVPDRYPEVRAAVARLITGTGESIPFTLWKTIVDYPYTKVNDLDIANSLDLGATLNGDVLVDSRTFFQETGEDEDWRWLAHIVAVYGANRLMGIFNAPEQMAKDGTKLPPGSDIGIAILQIALSWGMWETLKGRDDARAAEEWSTDALKGYTELDVAGNDIKANINAVRARSTEILDQYYAQLGQDDADRDIVQRFAQNFLVSTEEAGYEPWISYAHVRRIGHKNRLTQEMGQYYTVSAQRSSNVPEDLVNLLECEAERSNEQLDRSAAILVTKYTKDMICCGLKSFVQMAGGAGRVNVEVLGLVRRLLSFYISLNGGKWLKSYFDMSTPNWEGLLREKIFNAILAKLREVVFELVQPVTDWISRIGTTDLGACLPFSETVDLMIKTIEDLLDVLSDFILGVFESVQFQEQISTDLDLRLPGIQRARHLIRMIDSIIQAIDFGFTCPPIDEQTVSIERYVDLINDVDSLLPPVISLPVPIGDPYIDFNEIQWKTQGVSVPVGNNVKQVPSGDQPLRDVVLDCMRRNPQGIPVATELIGL